MGEFGGDASNDCQRSVMDTLGSLLVHLIYGIVTVLVIGQFWHP